MTEFDVTPGRISHQHRCLFFFVNFFVTTAFFADVCLSSAAVSPRDCQTVQALSLLTLLCGHTNHDAVALLGAIGRCLCQVLI